jgi:osmotically-inducible protein OsmY
MMTRCRKTFALLGSITTLTLLLGASGCDRSGGTKNETPTAPDSSPGNLKISSSELENAIKAKYKADDQLRAAELGVTADAEKNEVTLSGSVPSQALRSKAVALAKSAQSGVTVTDKIDVKPNA